MALASFSICGIDFSTAIGTILSSVLIPFKISKTDILSMSLYFDSCSVILFMEIICCKGRYFMIELEIMLIIETILERRFQPSKYLCKKVMRPK
ncbi:hypothetical protein D9M68_651360 [compost metagenome]